MTHNLEFDLQKILHDRLQVSFAEIETYCHRWQIIEFALFGSVLRQDFRPDSDVDVLITFVPDHPWSLFDVIHVQQELEELLGREVDLTQKQNLTNPFSRAEILSTHQIIYPLEKAAPFEIQAANKLMHDAARNNAALLDMAQSIQEIQEFIQGISYEQYLDNLLLRRAVERNCEIIGEAARRITPQFRATHPEVSWSGAVGPRSVLIHQYDRINDAEVWRILTTELPGLLKQIQALLPPLPPSE